MWKFYCRTVCTARTARYCKHHIIDVENTLATKLTKGTCKQLDMAQYLHREKRRHCGHMVFNENNFSKVARGWGDCFRCGFNQREPGCPKALVFYILTLNRSAWDIREDTSQSILYFLKNCRNRHEWIIGILRWDNVDVLENVTEKQTKEGNLCWSWRERTAPCLGPVRRFPSPSRSIRFSDVSETNGLTFSHGPHFRREEKWGLGTRQDRAQVKTDMVGFIALAFSSSRIILK